MAKAVTDRYIKRYRDRDSDREERVVQRQMERLK